MPEYIYTTKRKMLLEERAKLSDAISEAYTALSMLISGEISSYNLGSWTITRKQEDLDKLQAWIDARRVRMDEIDNILSGRSARKVSTCVYQNPQGVGWWRL
jgi:hypothetical protein